VQWNRLASEMTANIRLGLAAGECVSPRPSARLPLRWGFGGFPAGGLRRLGIACAVLCGLAGIGFILQHPPSARQWSLRMPGTSGTSLSAASGTILEASESGLQISEGSQILRLLNTSGTEVSRSVGARGEVGARYLDSNGYVTVSQVYGQ
jgi:hypothetical protein